MVEREVPSVAPRLEEPSLASPRRPHPRRSRARAIASKLLFVTLFAAVATLFVLALAKKLAASGYVPQLSGLFAGTR